MWCVIVVFVCVCMCARVRAVTTLTTHLCVAGIMLISWVAWMLADLFQLHLFFTLFLLIFIPFFWQVHNFLNLQA